jgi:hypothetical protein
MSPEIVWEAALALEAWSVLVEMSEEEVVVNVIEALEDLLMAILAQFLLMVFVWDILLWQKMRIRIAYILMPVVE